MPDITPDMLVRRVTLDEYFRSWVPGDLAARNPRVQQAMEARRQELATIMRESDELWEWKAGPHEFAEDGGLVVLRRGQAVWSSKDWKS